MPERRFVLSLVLGIGIAGALLLAWPGAFAQMERLSYDVRMRLTALPSRADTRIVVCEIDDRSLRDLSRTDGIDWPWPRELFGEVVRFLREGGAKAVVFDILFDSPSRWSPGDDAAFASALREAGGVVLAATFSRAEVPAFADERIRRTALPWPGMPGSAPGFRSASPPVDPLVSASEGIGNVTPQADEDGVLRRIQPAVRLHGRMYPSLALATAQVVHGRRARTTALWRSLTLGGGTVPLDDDGNMVLRFHGGARAYRRVSILDVILSCRLRLEGKPPLVDPASFRDAVVFIGATAQGLYDFKATPVGGHYPGVEIHATALDNLLAGRAVRDETAGLPWLLTLIVPCAALAVAAGAGARSLALSLGLWVLLVACVLGGSAWAFALGLAIPTVLPLLAATTCYAASSSLHHLGEARQRRQVERAFSHYVHPEVVRELARDPGKLRLGGEEREMTVLFSDIAGFTPIAERLEPQAMVSLLSDYLTEMSEILHAHRGTLDKYIGDGIMAFWGAPLPQAEHAVLACEAALDCQARLRAMGPSLAARGLPPLSARIGINTGWMNVGNMGSRMLFNYTVQG
ncbi:MAG: adenylate/guanylate cyclase domain-containing protein, partial [Planctomycetes bacterium]|nr:adenylate/guanylate cyclase domain-containing protein [Planctomycetota bacterium]